MSYPAKVCESSHPYFARGVRLHFDEKRRTWALLAPERVFELEGPSYEILNRCTGTPTVAEIIDELVAAYNVSRPMIAVDVLALLQELVVKRVILI